MLKQKREAKNRHYGGKRRRRRTKPEGRREGGWEKKKEKRGTEEGGDRLIHVTSARTWIAEWWARRSGGAPEQWSLHHLHEASAARERGRLAPSNGVEEREVGAKWSGVPQASSERKEPVTAFRRGTEFRSTCAWRAQSGRRRSGVSAMRCGREQAKGCKAERGGTGLW